MKKEIQASTVTVWLKTFFFLIFRKFFYIVYVNSKIGINNLVKICEAMGIHSLELQIF